MIPVSVKICRTDCQTPTVIFFKGEILMLPRNLLFLVINYKLMVSFYFFFNASFWIVLRRWSKCYTEGLEEEHTMLIDLSYLLASTKKHNRQSPRSVHSIGSQVHQASIYFTVIFYLISFKELLRSYSVICSEKWVIGKYEILNSTVTQRLKLFFEIHKNVLLLAIMSQYLFNTQWSKFLGINGPKFLYWNSVVALAASGISVLVKALSTKTLSLCCM